MYGDLTTKSQRLDSYIKGKVKAKAKEAAACNQCKQEWGELGKCERHSTLKKHEQKRI